MLELDGFDIAGWQKHSFIDYPGAVSTVLFLSGCNLRCPYCHNPGIVQKQYPRIPFDDIRAHAIKRKGILEAAVISGGEPTLHAGLEFLCDELRTLGLRIKIDTNGLEPEKIAACAPDYLALDIKTAIEKYPRLLNTPQSYRDYRERLGMSVDIAKRMGQNAEVRITAAPGIINKDDIAGLRGELRGVSKLYIQQFTRHPNTQLLDPSYQPAKPYDSVELEEWRNMFLNAGINCEIRD